MVEVTVKDPFQNEHSHEETTESVQREASVTASCLGAEGRGD